MFCSLVELPDARKAGWHSSCSSWDREVLVSSKSIIIPLFKVSLKLTERLKAHQARSLTRSSKLFRCILIFEDLDHGHLNIFRELEITRLLSFHKHQGLCGPKRCQSTSENVTLGNQWYYGHSLQQKKSSSGKSKGDAAEIFTLGGFRHLLVSYDRTVGSLCNPQREAAPPKGNS